MLGNARTNQGDIAFFNALIHPRHPWFKQKQFILQDSSWRCSPFVHGLVQIVIVAFLL